MQYYSGDSHIVEHADCFAGSTERFGDNAPQIIRDYNGKPGDWYVLARGGISIPDARLGIAGNRLGDPAAHELIEQGFMIPTHRPIVRITTKTTILSGKRPGK